MYSHDLKVIRSNKTSTKKIQQIPKQLHFMHFHFPTTILRMYTTSQIAFNIF